MLQFSSKIAKTLLLCASVSSVAMARVPNAPDMEINFSALSVLRKETVEQQKLLERKLKEVQEKHEVVMDLFNEEQLQMEKELQIKRELAFREYVKRLEAENRALLLKEEMAQEEKLPHIETAEEVQSSAFDIFGIFSKNRAAEKTLETKSLENQSLEQPKARTFSELYIEKPSGDKPKLADVQEKITNSAEIIKEKQEYLKNRPIKPLKSGNFTFEGEVRSDKLPEGNKSISKSENMEKFVERSPAGTFDDQKVYKDTENISNVKTLPKNELKESSKEVKPDQKSKKAQPVVKKEVKSSSKPVQTPTSKSSNVITLPSVSLQKEEMKSQVVVPESKEVELEFKVDISVENKQPSSVLPKNAEISKKEETEKVKNEVKIVEVNEKPKNILVKEPKLEQTKISTKEKLETQQVQNTQKQGVSKIPETSKKDESSIKALEVTKTPVGTTVDKPSEEKERPSKPSISNAANVNIINYKPGIFEISDAQTAEINKIIKAYNSKQRIKVVGYASDTVTGDDKKSNARRIALQRVIEVRKVLLQNGIDPMSIVVQAMGADGVKSDLSKDRVEISVE